MLGGYVTFPEKYLAILSFGGSLQRPNRLQMCFGSDVDLRKNNALSTFLREGCIFKARLYEWKEIRLKLIAYY